MKTVQAYMNDPRITGETRPIVLPRRSWGATAPVKLFRNRRYHKDGIGKLQREAVMSAAWRDSRY
jgi:hypothetical protein